MFQNNAITLAAIVAATVSATMRCLSAAMPLVIITDIVNILLYEYSSQ